MSNFREQLRDLTDEQFSDVAHLVDSERAKRAPKKDIRDLSNHEFFRHADELCRQGDRAKAEKAQSND
jgi:hypothetical protein